jgi:hypothetical protein
MKPYKYFASWDDAMRRINSMMGWDAEPVEVNCVNGTAWVIRCNGNKYLREDEYVE